MKMHFDTNNYDFSKIVNKIIHINGNKILNYFFEQGSTDPMNLRTFSSSEGKLEWLDSCNDILDIGAGCGQTVNLLKQKGKNVTGIVCNPKEIVIARQEYNIDLLLADMHDLPFEDNSFDGIIMWDVLEHSIAPFIALSEAKRVLKMGGRMLIFMPDENWIECSYHYSVLYPKQMQFLCDRLGLQIVSNTDGVYSIQKIEFNKEEFNNKYFK